MTLRGRVEWVATLPIFGVAVGVIVADGKADDRYEFWNFNVQADRFVTFDVVDGAYSKYAVNVVPI